MKTRLESVQGLFNLDFKNSIVKNSKIERVCKKFNKDYIIRQNIKDCKISDNEIDYLIEDFYQEKDDESLHLRKSSSLNVKFAVRDSIYYIFVDKNTDFQHLSEELKDKESVMIFESQNLAQKLEDFNLTTENTVTFYKDISSIFRNSDINSISYRDLKVYISGYYKNYDKNSQNEGLMNLSMKMNLSKEDTIKLRKLLKINPGDLVPQDKELTNILYKLKKVLGNNLLKREEEFLKSLILDLYINIEGRFPNLIDLSTEVEKSKLKNKDKISLELKETNESIKKIKESTINYDISEDVFPPSFGDIIHLKFGQLELDFLLKDGPFQNLFLDLYKLTKDPEIKKVLTQKDLSWVDDRELVAHPFLLQHSKWVSIENSIGIPNFLNLLVYLKNKYNLKVSRDFESEKKEGTTYPLLTIRKDLSEKFKDFEDYNLVN